MDDENTRRLLNAKLTTRGKDQGALIELLYPTIYKLSCLLDLRYVCCFFGNWSSPRIQFIFRFFPFDVQVRYSSSSSINELREEKITLGITTLLSMSILIFMVSDKMPSTSSFIPLIGQCACISVLRKIFCISNCRLVLHQYDPVDIVVNASGFYSYLYPEARYAVPLGWFGSVE
ncbi:hypothetical protein ANCCEY_01768 [Ancylostoma ceylanicum]|uniref:Neurotransmitter-gated ion-channel transmembrane domain-containing protein n=1 Tax=Ancylostoma ceylanicum TaxID=53326 RepID=A0A0D6M4Q2_9BILA|nr:hypothetical protein ANCCEY_01768 [Ancylostoma ceylanicum]